jgi:hypothetical protein
MTLSPNFEIFDPNFVKPKEGATVSLQRRGTFALNREAFEEIGSPEAVHLLYDPQLHIVGFRAFIAGAPRTYPVTVHNTGRTYLINARSFCLYYKIDLTEARLFGAQLIGEVLAINLKEPLVITTRHTNQTVFPGERVANRVESAPT